MNKHVETFHALIISVLGGLSLFLVGWGIYLRAGAIPYWIVALIIGFAFSYLTKIKNTEHKESLTLQFILGSFLFGGVLILVICVLEPAPAVHAGLVGITLVLLAGYFSIVFNHRLNNNDDSK